MAKKNIFEKDLIIDPNDQDPPIDALSFDEYNASSDVQEWEQGFDFSKIEKAKERDYIPPAFKPRLNKRYLLKILTVPFNPKNEKGEPLTRLIKEELVKVWAVKVAIEGEITQTFYFDQLSLFNLTTFRQKNNLSPTQLVGKTIEVQKVDNGFYNGKPSYKINTRFLL